MWTHLILVSCLFFSIVRDVNAGSIQLVIYDFEGTITSLHLSNPLMNMNHESMREQVSVLNNCTTRHAISLFGGPERLSILQNHFERLTSNGIDLGIVSFTHREVILMALIKVRLASYFKLNRIFGADQTLKYEVSSQSRHSIKGTIISRHFVGFPAESKLFVDNEFINMQAAERKGVAKIFDAMKVGRITNGLSVPQLSWIEAQCINDTS